MATTETPVRMEQSPKRVRVRLESRYVADTFPLLVWEKSSYPTYFFPREALDAAALGEGRSYTHPDAALSGHVALRWGAFDHWFEEDEEVFVHARDPYKRIEILRSTRHVIVELDGVTLADSHRPTMLFETTLPSRHYLPMTDVGMDLLEPSSMRTQCPYKGEAHYWNVRLGDTIHRDLVWSYATPVRESAPIAGLLCFYDEKLDITVDGVRQTRPTSPFS